MLVIQESLIKLKQMHSNTRSVALIECCSLAFGGGTAKGRACNGEQSCYGRSLALARIFGPTLADTSFKIRHRRPP